MSLSVDIVNCYTRQALCVALEGELGSDGAYRMLRCLKGQDVSNCRDVFLDLRRVSEMAAPALGALLMAKAWLEPAVNQVNLYCLDGKVQQLLHVAGFQKVFNLEVHSVMDGCMVGGPCHAMNRT